MRISINTVQQHGDLPVPGRLRSHTACKTVATEQTFPAAPLTSTIPYDQNTAYTLVSESCHPSPHRTISRPLRTRKPLLWSQGSVHLNHRLNKNQRLSFSSQPGLLASLKNLSSSKERRGDQRDPGSKSTSPRNDGCCDTRCCKKVRAAKTVWRSSWTTMTTFQQVSNYLIFCCLGSLPC
jgi:hypothetical protein